jgi:hypothetical protein
MEVAVKPRLMELNFQLEDNWLPQNLVAAFDLVDNTKRISSESNLLGLNSRHGV